MQISDTAVIPSWFCFKSHATGSCLFGEKYCQGLKRIVDIVTAAALLLLFLPAMAVIAFLIRLTSRGPIIFRQWRVGHNGRPFLMYKFRSMFVHPEENDEWVSVPDDPRFTPFGKRLRPTHLDELPQLWNALRGEMSLVGPRPRPLPHAGELACQLPGYKERHCVKPGITGLAQVVLKRELSLEHFRSSLECDLAYIRHCCMLNDLKILWWTVFAVLGRNGL